MQCPNCGKEAINVNGKFVCLDCGVEITPGEPSTASSQPVTPSVIKHDDPINQSLQNTPVDNGSDTQTQQSDMKNSLNDPVQLTSGQATNNDVSGSSIQSDTDSLNQNLQTPNDKNTLNDTTDAPQEPIKDYYLETLNRVDDTSVDSGDEEEDMVKTSKSKEVNNTSPAIVPNWPSDLTDSNEQEDNTVKEEKSFQEEPKEGGQSFAPADDFASVHPDFPPKSDTQGQGIDSGQSKEPEEEFYNQSSKTESDAIDKTEEAFSTPQNQPIDEVPINLSESNQMSHDATGTFEPSKKTEGLSSFNESTASGAKDQSTFDAYSTPAGIGSGEPNVSDLSQDQVKPEQTEASQLQTSEASAKPSESTSNITKPEERPNLDELLNKYSKSNLVPETPQTNQISEPQATQPKDMLTSQPTGTTPVQNVDSLVPAEDAKLQGQSETVSADSIQGASTIPKSAAIPSVESVFGSQADQPEKDIFLSETIKEQKKKKLFIIIGAVILAIIIIGGLIFWGVSLTQPKGGSEQGNQQEIMFNLSQEVSKAMDSPQNIVVDYEQSIDFSRTQTKKVETDPQKEEVLKLLFSNPVTGKGNWQGNEKGDYSVNVNLTNIIEKKIYLESEKNTYVYSAEGQNWAKESGFTITSIPSFFGIPSRGGLFYLTRVNNLEEENLEELDGGTYKKIKVTPKDDLLKDILKNSNKALTQTNFQSLNVENVEIFAWLDDSNKIYKVSVNGDVGVQSDLFEGTVTIKSEAKYKYKEVDIKKPEATT